MVITRIDYFPAFSALLVLLAFDTFNDTLPISSHRNRATLRIKSPSSIQRRPAAFESAGIRSDDNEMQNASIVPLIRGLRSHYALRCILVPPFRYSGSERWQGYPLFSLTANVFSAFTTKVVRYFCRAQVS